MTNTKLHTVPKVIRDTFEQILAHPEFEEFLIDPATIDWKDPDVQNSGWFDYPHLQEKYLNAVNNPLVDLKRERTQGTLPGMAGDASEEMRSLIGKLRRLFEWWLIESREDGDYVDLKHVEDFEKEYPGCQIIPLHPVDEGEPWYEDEEDQRPVIRTPRGIVILDSDVLHNDIVKNNTDWSV